MFISIICLYKSKNWSKSFSQFIEFFFRSSFPEVFCEKRILKNFAKFTGKHLCHSLFFNKIACSFIKKRLWYRCFPVNFVKFLKTPFFHKTAPGDCFWKMFYKKSALDFSGKFTGLAISPQL